MSKSASVQVIDLADGRQVCLSYGVIVAAFIPRVCVGLPVGERLAYSGPFGYIKTGRRYSVTTSKHANQFAGKDAPEVDTDTLQALCLPVVGRKA